MSSLQERFSRTLIAREAITTKEQNKRGIRGELECPICKVGKLKYSIANNGHIHAGCMTQGCVCWME